MTSIKQRSNLLKVIPASLYSRDLYKEAGSSWCGYGFVYLLVLLSICWLLIASFQSGKIWHHVNFFVGKVSPQMPEITIKNGVISTKEAGTFLIELKKAQNDELQLFAVVDTAGKFENFDKSSAMVLIQKNAVFVKHKKIVGAKKAELMSITKYTIPKFLDTKITFARIPIILKKAKHSIILLLFGVVMIFGLVMSYVYRVVQSLLYGLIALLFSKITKRKLAYAGAINMSLVAVTPAIILSTLVEILNMPFLLPAVAVISFLVTMGYLLYGVLSN